MHFLLCAHAFDSALYRGDTQAIFDGLDLTIDLSKGQAYQECCRGTVGTRAQGEVSGLGVPAAIPIPLTPRGRWRTSPGLGPAPCVSTRPRTGGL